MAAVFVSLLLARYQDLPLMPECQNFSAFGLPWAVADGRYQHLARFSVRRCRHPTTVGRARLMAGKHPKRNARPGVDRLGRTPLHYAAASGDVTTIRSILAQGADVNAADDNGWHPLHFSAQGNQVEASRVLLEAGAHVDPVDSNGNTPLSSAVFNSRGHGELILLLRTFGADPMKENHHGISPVALARSIGNFDVRQFFDDLPPS